MVERFERQDWLVAAVLFGVSLAMRVPFRSRFAYHWDSAQFALAIEHYNVSLGLPHLPGYFLFVMLGRAVNLLVGDPHTSLVWVAVIAGSALPALGYLLAAAIFGRQSGLVAGAILATSPLCWLHSEVAFTTIVDSANVTATVLLCWRSRRRGGGWRWVLAMAFMLAVVAGVRPQTGPTLIPVWLYAFSRFTQRRWRQLAGGLLLFGVFFAGWFVPMVQMSGGLGSYLRLYPALMQISAPLTIWSSGREALHVDLAFIVASCWVGLLAAGFFGATELLLWLMRERDRRAAYLRHREALRFLAIWVVPMVAFGFAAYTTSPGYVLNYFPATVIVVAWALCRLVRRSLLSGNRRRLALAVIIAGVTLTNCAVFLLPPRKTAWLRAGLPLTASDIREHDEQLARWFRAIRENYRADDVIICHHGQVFFWGFRHFQYHLPEYENYLLTTDRALPSPLDKKLWCAKNRRTEFRDKLEINGRHTLILVVPPGRTVDAFADVLDISHAKKWDIPESAPLYTISSSAE
jgi:hypothetical protein